MTANWIRGIEPSGIQLAHFRPPLIGLMLIPFQGIFGTLMGAKILMLALSVVPAFGMYGFSRQWVGRWLSLLSGMAVILIPGNAKLAALNQISLPAITVALIALAQLVRVERGQGRWWTPAIPVFFLAGTNQTTTAVLVIISGIFWLISGRKFWVGKSLLLAGIISSPWLWFYQQNVPVLDGLYIPGLSFVIVPEWGSLAMGIFAATVFGYFHKGLALAILVLALLSCVKSPELISADVFDRGTRFLPVFAIVAGAALLATLQAGSARRRVLPWFTVVLTLVSGLWLWPRQFHASATYFNFVSANDKQGLDWLRANTSSDAKIMAYPDALGWYVGGYSVRKWGGVSGAGQPLLAYQQLESDFSCAVGWVRACDPLALLSRDGVSYILIDKSSWQSIADNGAGWLGLRELPWLQLQRAFGAVEIYKIKE